MEFIDLKAQYAVLKEKIDGQINDVLESGAFIFGAQVRELEKNLADFAGVKHCITCANGTDALSLALMVWDVKEGDAVFVPSFTFMATAEVVSLCGATPVFIDIEDGGFNICSDGLETAIVKTLKEGKLIPKAVIPVDLFGLPADYAKITDIARKYNLHLLEDAAQGFGGSIDGKRACAFGDISTTSFFPAKPLGCYGDGGAIFTNDDGIADLLRSLRVHGKGNDKYDNVRVGVNSRLDTIQSAILIPKLEAFEKTELESRDRAAKLYTRLLKDTVQTPRIPDGYFSSWAQYAIMLPSQKIRDALAAHLKGKGIPTMVYYPRPLHLQTAYASLGWREGSLPRCEAASRQILCLPMHPYLETAQIEQIANEICLFLG